MVDYIAKVTHDNNGKWSYGKSFDVMLTKSKKKAYETIVDELRQLERTIKGKPHYVNDIKDSVGHLLKMTDSKRVSYADYYKFFNKDASEIYFSFESGNASYEIEIIPVRVSKEAECVKILQEF